MACKPAGGTMAGSAPPKALGVKTKQNRLSKAMPQKICTLILLPASEQKFQNKFWAFIFLIIENCLVSGRLIEHEGGKDGGGTAIPIGKEQLDTPGKFKSQPFSLLEILNRARRDEGVTLQVLDFDGFLTPFLVVIANINSHLVRFHIADIKGE